ncbi:MAG TPA: zinc ribbon domain-containing protein [Anaerolineae bacterium]|nr:zinc ribbon domain-containing protein [Anaerolineae bacterium]
MSAHSMRCPKCGTLNRAGARFCANCRTNLAAPILATQKTCPNCHKPNRMDAHFCAHCGHVFRASSARAPIPPWIGARVGRIPALALAGVMGLALVILGVGVLTLMNVFAAGRATPTVNPSAHVPSTFVAHATNAVPLSTFTLIPTAVPTALPTMVPSRTLVPTLTPTATAPPPTFAADEALNRTLRATVMLIVPIEGLPRQSIFGSGSVITRRGYILTNNHLFYDENGQPFNSQFQAYIAFQMIAWWKGDVRLKLSTTPLWSRVMPRMTLPWFVLRHLWKGAHCLLI